ncbi:MAG TPA: ATP-binding cassette domain-containing protein [Firmicutes bacterium]|nr:ATP-binding cassette domain-containing protein [Bacillota bacterium]
MLERGRAVAPAIHLVRVSKRFGATVAVSEIDLAVHPGELVAAVGPDGAGKTTLARLAAGVLAPSAGRVEPDPRGRVGYLSGRFSLYPDLTVWENLTFLARLNGMAPGAVEAEAGRLLQWTGLLPFRGRLAGQLSGGMRQKLALACAVIHRPPLLVLDEPTTGVDPVARAELWELLRHQAAEGRAVLITTPYLDEGESCHRVALLYRGRLLAAGSPAALKARFPFQTAVLIPADGQWRRRALALAAAHQLPGVRWAYPLGAGVRVALEPGLSPVPPPGYRLVPSAPNLEDVYVWLSEGDGRSDAAGRGEGTSRGGGRPDRQQLDRRWHGRWWHSWRWHGRRWHGPYGPDGQGEVPAR